MAEKTTVPVRVEEPGLRRWDPLDMLDQMQQEMARWWGRAWPLAPRPLRPFLARPTFWTPCIDVFERNGNLIVKAELPGVKKEDIEVSLDDGELLIRGERKAESEVEEENYFRLERSYGSFYRRLPLPANVKAEQISAKFADGVLEIQVPKPVETRSKPRHITIA